MRLNDIMGVEAQISEAKKSSVQIYRGALDMGTTLIRSIRQNRKPRNSPDWQVLVFDTLMDANQWPHRKSNTLSTSTDIEQASGFGTLYKIYPFNGSSYIGSTEYKDFISIPAKINNIFYARTKLHLQVSKDFLKDMMPIMAFIQDNHLELTEICGLVYSNRLEDMKGSVGEILVHGDQYLAVNDNHNRIDKDDRFL